MKGGQLHKLYGRVMNVLRDRAHAGHLPKWFQGSIRSISVSHPDSPLKGVVIGVPRLYWRDIEGAYPEWDLRFARRNATADELASELGRLGAVAILGPFPKRGQALAVQSSSAPSLRLSPAPIPILKADNRIARGFVLEPSTSWLTARRASEMELLLDHPEILASPLMQADATELKKLLSLPASQERTLLVLDSAQRDKQWTAEELATIRKLATAKRQTIRRLVVRPGQLWNDADYLGYETALAQSEEVITKRNPFAVNSLLRGRAPIVVGQTFLSQTGVYKALTQKGTVSASKSAVSLNMLTAVCVFVAARYAHEGTAVDPLAFMQPSAIARPEVMS